MCIGSIVAGGEVIEKLDAFEKVTYFLVNHARPAS